MKHSQKFLQQRRFVMILPLLVLPFITMIFWALGGGQGTALIAAPSQKSGFNLELPEAQIKDEKKNKLSLYDQAQRDSLKSKEAREHDPYFNLASLEDLDNNEERDSGSEDFQFNSSISKTIPQTKRSGALDPNELKVNQKLEELVKELNRKPVTVTQKKVALHTSSSGIQFSPEVQKLEQMMTMMNGRERSDPEMEKIGGMLDKILDIQHPERLREKLKKQSELTKGQVFPVETLPEASNIGLLDHIKNETNSRLDTTALLSQVIKAGQFENSFYGLDDEPMQKDQGVNSIAAVIHDTQELVAGAVVKMRLVNDVYINGQLLTGGQLIYGTCAINGERLIITINSIRDENSLLPVSLSAFDLDGLEGLYIPGAITRDVAKQSSDQALQSMQFMTMDQSLSGQAANAGVQAAKGLFSKKVKLVKVTVKAGYQILLKDGNVRS